MSDTVHRSGALITCGFDTVTWLSKKFGPEFFFGADGYLSSLLTSVAGLGEGLSTSIARYGVGEKQFEICSLSRPKNGLCQGGTTKLISFVGSQLQQQRQ